MEILIGARKRTLFSHCFSHGKSPFVKTGSGQTERNLNKKVSFAANASFQLTVCYLSPALRLLNHTYCAQ